MDEENLEKIGELAETLDSALFMAKTGDKLPPHIHLTGLKATMENVRDELIEIYENNGGTEDLNIQA